MRNPPNRLPETPFDQLLRLDSLARPGLSELEFRKLFVKCRCGKVTTSRVFKEHICAIVSDGPDPDILDLTVSSEDSDGDSSAIDLTSDSEDELIIDLTGEI